jgi:EmrB/QacA subfamily drug resistance transporter
VSVSPSGSAHAAAVHFSRRRRALAITVVAIAFVMDLIDSTIVNVAIPSIQADLRIPYSAVQWVVAGYTLAFAAILITGGRLGDVYGYKRLFLIGVAGFAAASALCGLAWSSPILIVARLLQGAMAAMMVPQIMSLVQVMYEPRERLGVLSALGLLGGTAGVLGPVVAGLLTGANLFGLGWRPIFLVNIPCAAFALAAGAWLLPAGRSTHPLRLDGTGTVLATGAMLLLVFPLIEGRYFDRSAPIIVMLIASAILFAVFARHARRRMQQDGSPLVVPGLFLDRGFLYGSLISWLYSAAITGFMLSYTVMLQNGLGYSMLHAGLAHAPFAAGAGLTMSVMSRMLTLRLGRYVLTLGMTLSAIGFASLMVLISRPESAPLGLWAIGPCVLVAGIGLGLTVSPLPAFSLASVPLRDAGSASGVMNTATQLGNAIGAALIGTVLFAAMEPPRALERAPEVRQLEVTRGFERSNGVVLCLLGAAILLSLRMPRHLQNAAKAL